MLKLFIIIVFAWPAHALELNELFDFNFEMEFEYVGSEYKAPPPVGFSQNYFQLGKISLQPQMKSPDGKMTFKMDLRFDEDESRVRKAYLDWREPALYSRLLVGRNTPYFRVERDSNVYDLPGFIFGKNERVGLEYHLEFQILKAFLAASNGTKLTSSPSTDHDPLDTIKDEDLDQDDNNNLELGYGLELSYMFDKDTEIKAMAFHYLQDLSDEDVTYLEGIEPGVSGDEKSDLMGANLAVDAFNFEVRSQYVDSYSGNLRREAWMGRLAYKLTTEDWLPLKWIKPFVSHSGLEVDLIKDPAISETWNKRRTTLGLLTKANKWTRWLLEYNFEEEDTGGDKVDNNGVLLQMILEI